MGAVQLVLLIGRALSASLFWLIQLITAPFGGLDLL